MWKDKIILQVEFWFFSDDSFSPYPDCRKSYAWRDATLEDLTIDTDVQLNCKGK